MSRGIIEAQTLRSEQFEFEARTSDPADAQPGEYWIRTDQTGSNPDKIAELRRQGNSSVTAAPIFAAAEESNLGSDVVRGPSVVLDGGSVGFVVMTTGDGGVGSPRAINSAGTQYVSHDALELVTIPDSAIPDSGLYHRYETKDMSVSDGTDSNYPDQFASADLTAQKITDNTSNTGSQPTYLDNDTNFKTTVPVLDFASDEIGSSFTTINAPMRLFVVARPTETITNSTLWMLHNFVSTQDFGIALTASETFGYKDGSGNFVYTDTSADTQPHLFEIDISTSDSSFILDETQIGSTSSGGVSLEGLTVGNRYDTSRYLNHHNVAILAYDTTASGYSTSDVRQYLYDRYGDGNSIN